MEKKQRETCLRMAILIPATNIAGILIAGFLFQFYQGRNPEPWAYKDVFSWLWPWTQLLAGVALLILGRAGWLHYCWFVIIASIAWMWWPLYY